MPLLLLVVVAVAPELMETEGLRRRGDMCNKGAKRRRAAKDLRGLWGGGVLGEPATPCLGDAAKG